MTKSKLLLLFYSLDSADYRWVLDFLRSPYFNKNNEVVLLATEIIGRIRTGNTDYDKETLFTAAFPGETFSVKRFHHLASHLLKLLERFLAQRAFESEEALAGLYHLRGCSSDGQEKSLAGRQRISRELLTSLSNEDPDHLLRSFLVTREEHRNFTRTGERKHDPYLQQTADELDAFYFAQKLRLSCTMVNAKLAIGSNFQFRFLPYIDPTVLHELPGSKLARLYAAAYQLLTTRNDPDRFLSYTRLVRLHARGLAASEIGELFNHATNYCIRQIRAGHRNFITHLLELYRENLSKGYLLGEDGRLSPWSYKNIVKLGLGLKEFDWVTEVVETYSQRLPAADQSDAYHFSMADISYHRQNYPDALDYLNRTEFTDIHYALGAKVMLIKIYYETDAFDALESLLFSFKVYLKRNKRIGNDTKLAYHNFVRFTEQLLKGGDQEKLKIKIEAAEALTDRSWLIKELAA